MLWSGCEEGVGSRLLLRGTRRSDLQSCFSIFRGVGQGEEIRVGLVETEAVVDVGGSRDVQGLERVGEEFELASFLDWEPVKTSQVWGDMCSSQEVED